MVQLWGSCQSCRKPPAWGACWQPQPMGILPVGQLTSSLTTSCPQILQHSMSIHRRVDTPTLVHTMEPYWAIKKELLGCMSTWINGAWGGLSETRGYQGIHYMLPFTRSHMTVRTHLWWLTSENGQEKKGVCLEEAHGKFLGWWKCFTFSFGWWLQRFIQLSKLSELNTWGSVDFTVLPQLLHLK